MNVDIFSLKNKKALISGGGSGIGFGIAQYLAKAGAEVILVGRDEEKLKNAAADLKKNNYVSSYFICDLTDDRQLVGCAHEVLAEHKCIDILVNAAGVNFREKADDVSFDSWDTTIDINLRAPFFLSRIFIEEMKNQKWGKIINVASLQSARAFDNSIPYGASKGGVVQLTRAMAQEYSKYGICVNAIAPGFFQTYLTSGIFQDEMKVKELANKTAIKRNGLISDFEGISIFLASKASDYITGQTIFLDGGFSSL